MRTSDCLKYLDLNDRPHDHETLGLFWTTAGCNPLFLSGSATCAPLIRPYRVCLLCTRGVLYIHAGEERFRLLDLGPDAIGMVAQRHELRVVSLCSLLI